MPLSPSPPLSSTPDAVSASSGVLMCSRTSRPALESSGSYAAIGTTPPGAPAMQEEGYGAGEEPPVNRTLAVS